MKTRIIGFIFIIVCLVTFYAIFNSGATPEQPTPTHNSDFNSLKGLSIN